MKVKDSPNLALAASPARPMPGQLSDMDLRLLRVFKAVADCGGMAAAELELNVGVSTISRQIKDLETRLGLTLCRRGRAGFALTDEGQQVYEQTLHLLGAVDGFRSRIGAIHGELVGELSLALFDKTATNPQARIGDAIALFAAQAPGVALQVHVTSITAIERGVIDGRFQLGVIPTHRASRSLAYVDLFGEAMRLYAGAGHPLFDSAGNTGSTGGTARLGWSTLRGHAFAGLGYHSPNMQLAHARQLARAATGFDQEAIAWLILSGRYLGFLPRHYARSFEDEGRLRAIGGERLGYDCRFAAIWRRSPEPTRATALFAHCLAQAHGAVMA